MTESARARWVSHGFAEGAVLLAIVGWWLTARGVPSFVLPGPAVTEREWQCCIDHIDALDVPPRYLVTSGSLPPGAPTDIYARLASSARARGTRVVLDTSGPALAAALDAGVWLVKPSLNELRDLTGRSLASEAEWKGAAQEIVHDGRAHLLTFP